MYLLRGGRQIRADCDVLPSCIALCCRGLYVITLPADRSGKPGRKRGREGERKGEGEREREKELCKKGLKSCAPSSSSFSSAPPLLRWKKCPLHGTFARLSGCLNIADEKQTERLDCDTPLLKVQDEVWRAVGEAAPTPLAGATRPALKVGRIPDSWV